MFQGGIPATALWRSSILLASVVTMNLGLASAQITAGAEPGRETRDLPPLKAPVTSLGAAIIGDDLFIYGGQLGSAHSYSADQQANQLLRLNLSKPAAWSEVSSGPRRTGLAMVAHGGQLYRVGGFEARNAAGEKQDLHSTKDFARFDPKSGKWTELTPLPAGRSSHDAAVLGNQLFVIGGWELRGAGDGTWHDTALVCDLNAEKPIWKETAKPPFMRRALAVAAGRDKLYVMGGMDDSNEMSAAVNVYDPQSARWSLGPTLPGKPADAFGASAIGSPTQIYVTSALGTVYRLAEDGQSWEEAAKLQHARTFHRLLLDNTGSLIAVGGTARGQGKVAQLESLNMSK